MYRAEDRRRIAEELTCAFLQGEWRAEALAERGAGVLTEWPPWLDSLAFATVALARTAPIDAGERVVAFVARFLERFEGPADAAPPGLVRFAAEGVDRPGIAQGRAIAHDRVIAHDWPIARIDSPAALAEALELSDGQLAWLADVRGLERSVGDERLRNYRYRWIPRRAGLPRLIEAPKLRLKEVQRWMLREILDAVPPHDAAHGFTRGRSVHTHAGAHVGRAAVLRLDLRDFFASVSAGRVFGIFRTLGYERPVAHALTGLATNVVPHVVWDALGRGDALGRAERSDQVGAHFALGRRLATPHLPQGAPSSPALANLAAHGLDRRLAGLAAVHGLRYTRYADDLTFSGDGLTGGRARRLTERSAEIAREEGFHLHPAKSRLRTAARRQTVTGIVVNVRPNLARDEYDRLKATLHRLAHDGPTAAAGVDLRAQLNGRVAWVESLNPPRGAKLRGLFEAIDWRNA